MLKRCQRTFVLLLFKNDVSVTICKLNYDKRVTEVVSKCTASLCKINRVRHVLDKKTLLSAINALVFTKLYYCSSVWANTPKRNVAKLRNIQNFAARIVAGTRKYDHVTPSLH